MLKGRNAGLHSHIRLSTAEATPIAAKVPMRVGTTGTLGPGILSSSAAKVRWRRFWCLLRMAFPPKSPETWGDWT